MMEFTTIHSRRMAQLHDLDLEYHNGMYQTDRIQRDEEARRLKLQALSLRDENAILKDSLAQKDARIVSCASHNDQVRSELDDAKRVAHGQSARLKKQALEISNLKAEIEALNETLQDSGKALQEKFALSRDLARLRPEVEHLQSQLVNHQAVVAEKHDLRRQLDSLEVELDNERRSKQRARGKEESDAINDVRSRLEAAEKRLAADKRDREKHAREHAKELTEANSRHERLEERAAAIKIKLKDAHIEVKEVQADLERCRTELETANAALQRMGQRTNKTTAKTSEPNRKRRAEEMSLEEISIQTPGNENGMSKHPVKKRGTAGLGEKSSFSVTPFLKRSSAPADGSAVAPTNLATMDELDLDSPPAPTRIESSEEEVRALTPDDESQVEARTLPGSRTAPVESPKQQRPRGRPRMNALSEATGSKQNISATGAERQRSASQRLDADTAPEEDTSADTQGNQENAAAPSLHKRPTVPIKASELQGRRASARPGDGEIRKRKRKLLGGANQTLLDEDDGDIVPRPPAKVASSQTRRVKASLGGAVANAFAGGSSFSPLKKDRRGVHASFLV